MKLFISLCCVALNFFLFFKHKNLNCVQAIISTHAVSIHQKKRTNYLLAGSSSSQGTHLQSEPSHIALEPSLHVAPQPSP
jgi:hypothetical protein